MSKELNDLASLYAESQKDLHDLIDAIVEHDSNRDAEWDFIDNHGNNGFWTDEEQEEHDEILADIQKSHDRILSIIRRVTGDDKFVF